MADASVDRWQTIIPTDFALLIHAKSRNSPTHADRYAAQEARHRTAPRSRYPRSDRFDRVDSAGVKRGIMCCLCGFATPTLVSGIVQETGCDVIGMLKNGSLRYEWKGPRRTLAQIYRALRCTWSRYTVQGSIVVHLPTPANAVGRQIGFYPGSAWPTTRSGDFTANSGTLKPFSRLASLFSGWLRVSKPVL